VRQMVPGCELWIARILQMSPQLEHNEESVATVSNSHSAYIVPPSLNGIYRL